MELMLRSASLENDETFYFAEQSKKIKVLVDALHLVSAGKDIQVRKLSIPDGCEKYGFVEGNHNLGVLLHFLADMLEE